MAKADPWFKFHPADWRGDVGLRSCSLATRGFWIECLALMHMSVKYGHLLIAGRKPADGEIAQTVGCTVAEVRKHRAELLDKDVASETADGVLYSRRMVRDRAKADADRSNGSAGGNPQTRGGGAGGVNPPGGGGVNPRGGGRVNLGVGSGVGRGVKGGVNPQSPEDQTYSSNPESLQPRARGVGLAENQRLGGLEAAGLRIERQAGGFAKIVPGSAGNSRRSDPAAARQKLLKVLAGNFGMDEATALQTIDAASDVAHPQHHEAKSLCQKASHLHGCGWYADRQQIARQGETA